MDTDVRLTIPATRRTIVRTGVKFAYAAPLIATSLKLSPVRAADGTSPLHFVCTSADGECSCGPGCGANEDCFCATVVPSGAFVCAIDTPCGGGFCDAVTGAGCPVGALCVVDAFLEGRAHCHILCGAPCPAPANDSTRASALLH